MASFAAACRMSARLATRKLQQDASVRGFRTSAAALAAQNFSMPALSPTMTEGNIASWRVKEGDKFSAGDVLLEIETDKATMDVEAQEDGIVVKIMQGDGSKGVQVGTRIAVIAEEGDDISTLEIPADSAPASPQKSENAAPESSKSEAPTPQATPSVTAPPPTSAAAPKHAGRTPKTPYPPLPSVIHLLKTNGLDASALANITPTGPNGRLLKGDVLAHLGKIKAAAPAENSSRFEKASHLDLSNIKLAPPKPAPEAAKPAAAAPPPAPVKTVVSLPVSLAAVIEVQKKIHSQLGVFLPLSTFIARATDVANDELPLPAGYQPTADELFNQVLGLDKVGSGGSRGSYVPLIATAAPASALPATPSASSVSTKKVDILDILSAAPKKTVVPKTKTAVVPGASAGANLFRLQVPQAEEKRAKVFLERLKVVLEKEPGRLVL